MKRSFLPLLCRLFCMLVLANGAAAHHAHAAEPAVELHVGEQNQVLPRSELLKNPAVRTIVIPNDVAYKRTMTYRALPLKALVHLDQVQALQFKAEDGFAATLPVSLLTGASQPWIAIEPPNAPWPELKPGGRSAGAFYLVWLSPERSGVSPEQWPYQIAAIAASEALPEAHPQILPDTSIPKDSAEYRGLQVYSAHCASCHRINGGGEANVGPDLNLPFNPTEYFQASFLRRYIRDPASVRSWPNMTMPGFPQSVISEPQLNDLLAYLRSMARHRNGAKTTEVPPTPKDPTAKE
ncbi:MAG TPA: cytochrome c [Oxalicibacterium sp.]|nr:cytochrome c [Oxalicibacterium sp.]